MKTCLTWAVAALSSLAMVAHGEVRIGEVYQYLAGPYEISMTRPWTARLIECERAYMSVAVEVLGCENASVIPEVVLENAVAEKVVGKASVKTDAQMKALVYRNGYEIEENMATSESGGKEYEWEFSLWPDGKVNEGRKWIIVPVTRGVNGNGCWGGLPAFSVRLKGLDVASDSYYVEPDEDAMPKFNAKSIFGLACTQLGGSSVSGFKLKVNGSLNYMSDEDCKGITPSWMFDWNARKDKSVSMTIKVPEAGLLTIRGITASEFGDMHDWAAWQISGTGVSYESGAQQLKINCSDTTTVTLRNDEDDKFTMDNWLAFYMDDLAFYPAASKSVHVVGDFVVSRRVENAASENPIDEAFEAFYPLYVNGYVTGGGTFKPGEKLTMVANVAPGMKLDHWEITDRDSWNQMSAISFPDGTDTKAKTLSFVVPESFCGAMSEMKVIHVRPILVENPLATDPDVPELADSYGPFGPGEWVEIEIPGLAGYAAKGLPAGLKLDGKTGTISGAPTKPTGDAGVTVTFTRKGATTLTAQFIVGPLLNLSVNVIGAGRVSGAGAFAANRKVTLKATAAKGSVFAGWYADAACEEPFPADGADWRAPSLSHVMPTNDVTAYAKFVPAADDRAALSLAAADECAPKTAIEPIAVDVSGCTSLPTVKVKGLPPGLKFTAKALDVKATKTAPAAHYAANTVYGTPTRSGVYAATFTVTTAGKRTASTNVTFTVIDRTAGESFLKVACDAEMGKATGAGIYAAGKRVTLKATPQKGFVFAGWYAEDGEPLAGGVDWRTPSFPYVATGTDTTVRALFARAEEDASLELLVAEVYNTSGSFDLPLAVKSLSLPKIAVSGLPAGLKFDAKGLRISGTATKPGTYAVTAKLTNATVKKAIAKTFRIVVDNLTGANGLLAVTDAAGGAGSLMNGRGERYVMSVGVAEHGLPVLNAADAGDKVTLAGLPTGLRYDAKTGKVTGVATKAGMYTVRATVKSGKSSHVSTFTVEVAPLPSWAVGTFAGCGEGEIPGYDLAEDNLYGTVTVAANGKVSGRFLFDTGDERLLTSAFSAPALTGHDAEGGCYFLDVTLAFRDGKTVVESRECRLRIERNGGDAGIGGGMIDVSGADVTLYQNVWKVKGFGDLPVFAEKKTVVSRTMEIHGDEEVENGTSTITLVLDQKGGVSATLVEEGVDRGTPFRDRFAFKGDLIVIERWEEEGERFYEAEVPLVIGSLATAHVDVTMRVSPDGKVHADGCEITEWTDFGDWGPNE